MLFFYDILNRHFKITCYFKVVLYFFVLKQKYVFVLGDAKSHN